MTNFSKKDYIKSLFTAGLGLSISFSPLAIGAAEDVGQNLNASLKSVSIQNDDTKGAIGGGVAGAILYGPVGGIVGVVAGALLGESIGNANKNIVGNVDDLVRTTTENIKDFGDNVLGIDGGGKSYEIKSKGDRKRLERLNSDGAAARSCAKAIGMLNSGQDGKSKLSIHDLNLIKNLYFFNKYDLKHPKVSICARIQDQFLYFVDLTGSKTIAAKPDFLRTPLVPNYEGGYKKCESTFLKQLTLRDSQRAEEMEFLSRVFYRAHLERDFRNDASVQQRCEETRNQVRNFAENFLIRSPLTVETFQPFEVTFADVRKEDVASRRCATSISGNSADKMIFQKVFLRHRQSTNRWVVACEKTTADAKSLLGFRLGVKTDVNPKWVIDYTSKSICKNDLIPAPSKLDPDAFQFAKYLGGVVGYNYSKGTRNCKIAIKVTNALISDFLNAVLPVRQEASGLPATGSLPAEDLGSIAEDVGSGQGSNCTVSESSSSDPQLGQMNSGNCSGGLPVGDAAEPSKTSPPASTEPTSGLPAQDVAD